MIVLVCCVYKDGWYVRSASGVKFMAVLKRDKKYYYATMRRLKLVLKIVWRIYCSCECVVVYGVEL